MFSILKLLFFAALVLLGIVFVPDGFMDRVNRGIDSAFNYLSGQTTERMPKIKQDLSQQAQETKRDAQKLYSSFKEERWPVFKKWFVDSFIY